MALINDNDNGNTLTGDPGADDTIFGNGGNDTLFGLDANDSLDGGTGDDSMVGSTGDDTYVVDTIGDIVTELASEGTDLVQSSIDYTLGANVENLTLTGTADLNGTGNALANRITGNDGDNGISAGSGNDTIVSGRGSNDYVDGGANTDMLIVDYSTNTYAGANRGMTLNWALGQGDAYAWRDSSGNADYVNFDNVESAVVTATATANDTANDLNLGAGSVAGTFDNTAQNVIYGALTLKGFERFTNVTLAGGADNVVLAGIADDSFVLGAGNDTFNGGRGSDYVDGGTGSGDKLLVDYSANPYAGANSGMTFNWALGQGDASAWRDSAGNADNVNFDNMEGAVVTATATANDIARDLNLGVGTVAGTFDNTAQNVTYGVLNLKGFERFDGVTLAGGADNVVLTGIADDSFFLGAGNDTFNGGRGFDYVDAGTGTGDRLIVDYSANTYAGADSGMTFTWALGQGNASALRDSSGNYDYVDFDNMESAVVTATVTAKDIANDLYLGAGTAAGTFDNTAQNVTYGVLTLKGFESFTNVTLAGGADNVLLGGVADDSFVLGAGADTFNGGRGFDYVDAGTGTDLLVADYSSNTYAGTTNFPAGATFGINVNGDGSIFAYRDSLGNYDQVSFLGVDRVDVTGTAKVDTVTELHLEGDTVGTVFDGATQTVTAGSLATIKGFEQFQNVTLGSGNDKVSLTGVFNDSFVLGAGADTFNGGRGTDNVDAGQGTDLLVVDYSSNTYAGTADVPGGATFSINVNGDGSISAYRDSLGNADQVAFAGVDRVDVTGTAKVDTVTELHLEADTAGVVFNGATQTVTAGSLATIKGFEQFQNVTLGSGNDKVSLTGVFNDSFVLGAGADTFNGGRGSDYVDAGTGTDLLVVDYSSNTYTGTADYPAGAGFGINVNGDGSIFAFRDSLGSYDQVSFLGVDRVDVTGTAKVDTVTELHLEGDTVGSAFDNTTQNVNYGGLTAIKGFEQFQNVTLGAGADEVSLTGRFADSFDMGEGADTFNGGLGIDTIFGGGGDDLLVVNYSSNLYTGSAPAAGAILSVDGNGNGLIYAYRDTSSNYDQVQFNSIERLAVTATKAADSLLGGSGSDTLVGLGGNDTLDAGVSTKADSLDGGDGNDSLTAAGELGSTGRYYAISGSFTWEEAKADAESKGGHLATITSAAEQQQLAVNTGLPDYWLGATDKVTEGVWRWVTGEGFSYQNWTGGEPNNGNGGFEEDYLSGNLGGGMWYDGDNGPRGYFLELDAEAISPIGTTLAGGAGADTLLGGVGYNLLDGGTGNDSMTGGLGDDTYSVDSLTDKVVENAGEGTDLVQASISGYTLAANVENLTLIGTAGAGTGNTLNNVLTGNASANTLDGGAGLDTLAGGAGDDVYAVDSTTDTITELAGGGTDLVQSSVTFSLAALGQVENLTLTGTAGSGTGNALGNVLTGNASANTLNGGVGSDTMIGLAADDTYVIDVLTDVVTESAGEGTDRVQSSVSGYTLAANVENLTLTGTAAVGTGNTLDNLLTGNASANTLDGGAGVDTLAGGAGSDVYVVDSATDTITELAGEGTDLVQSSAVGYALGANVENLTLVGTAANGTGNTLNNVLTGNASANTLNGNTGRDTLVGLTGNDTYVIDILTDVVTEAAGEGTDAVLSSVSGYTLAANVENLTLIGTAATGTGNTLNNVLNGNASANTLDGGTGNDTLAGLTGNDTYVIDVLTDLVTEAANAGTDVVQSSVSGYTLGANVENLTLTGTVASGTGNTFNNVLTGNASANTLNGGTGNDTLVGLAGDDTYVVNVLTDVVTEAAGEGTDLIQSGVSGYTLTANVENLTLTSTAAAGTGNTLNNTLTGNASANTLNGGTGNDTLAGLTGNDTYVIDVLTDLVTEAAIAGTDVVQSSVSGYTLGANLENLTLIGTAATGTGNTFNNVLTGNASANTLDGGAGNDTLVGLAGDDTYVINILTDLVTEGAGEGTDLVQSSVSGYTLTANVENLTLTGTVAAGTGNTLNNALTGNAAANTLTGGAGNDTLNGSTGSDSLAGGIGDDTYVINVLTDVVTEAAGEGTDLVQSSVSGYTLTANVENLTLTGTAAAGTGNSLANLLTGNTAANILNGGTGNDTMEGLAGNDTYVIDVLTDVVNEAAGTGTDAVQSSVSGYTLTANVENLTLTGTAAAGTGNSLANLLTGNASANTLTGGSANDTLNGGAGTDSLAGGIGSDTYLIDRLTDVVTEAANEGTDSVQSSTSGYTLVSNVENLTLTGTAAKGTGNSLNNALTGNASANTLDGGAGNDTLTGADLTIRGVGEVDTLTGGANNDRFLLGDDTGRFYDDGNAALAGTADYALITDFTPGADRLQLTGTAAQYSLGASPVAGVTGTALYFDSNGAPGGADELIAILQSPSELKVENVITPALFV